MNELRVRLAELDAKSKELIEYIDGEIINDMKSSEELLLSSIQGDLYDLEYDITTYQKYKKWI